MQPDLETEDYAEGPIEEYEDSIPGNQRTFPIMDAVHLDNKIISSHANTKIFFFTPRFNIEEVGIPLLDENKQVVYVEEDFEGVKRKRPVIKKYIKLKFLVDYEKKEVDFPIVNWFNDSVPSSTLTKEEARYLRRIDDLGIKLARKMIKDPEKVQIMGTLERFNFQKNSIADSAKGIGGAGVESAKKQIMKSESNSRLYRLDRDELDEYRDRQGQKKKGLFGLGLGPF